MKDLAVEPNGKCSVELGDYSGQTIQLRWAFLSRNSGMAAIDNVEVSYASAVDCIGSETGETVDVYTVDGVTVARNITADAVKSLPVGIYILRSGSLTTKIHIR